MEQLARGVARARPDRDREQHDVAGGEAGDRQAADEIAADRVAARGVEGGRIEGPGGIAGALDRGEHGVGVARGGVEVDADAVAGEIGAGPGDAGESVEAVLDPADAGGAMHLRHEEVDVAGAVVLDADEGRVDLAGGRDEGGRRAAAAADGKRLARVHQPPFPPT